MADDIRSQLTVTERALGDDRETIERALSYKGERIAAAYFDTEADDYTLTWPIANTDLASLFEAYFSFVANLGSSIQSWIGERYDERGMETSDIQNAAATFRKEEQAARQPIDILNLVCRDAILEINFEGLSIPSGTIRLAVISRSVTDNLLSLFPRFHRNESIRPVLGEIGALAFLAPSGIGFQMLRR